MTQPKQVSRSHLCAVAILIMLFLAASITNVTLARSNISRASQQATSPQVTVVAQCTANGNVVADVTITAGESVQITAFHAVLIGAFDPTITYESPAGQTLQPGTSTTVTVTFSNFTVVEDPLHVEAVISFDGAMPELYPSNPIAAETCLPSATPSPSTPGTLPDTGTGDGGYQVALLILTSLLVLGFVVRAWHIQHDQP